MTSDTPERCGEAALPGDAALDARSAPEGERSGEPPDAFSPEPVFAADDDAPGEARDVFDVSAEGLQPHSTASALLAAVARLEARVSTEAERVLEAFREKLAFDASKEEQVTRLHAELQAHRDGLFERATHPLLNAVIRVHDDLGKVVAAVRARPAEEITPERTFRLLDGFREDLELLLAQHGVEPFEPLDDAFDPRLHTALRTVPTAAPERAGRIAQRLRPGFSRGGALLQKARVAVFTAQGAPAEAPPPAPSPAPIGEPE